MGKLKRKMRKRSKLAVELSDTGQRMVIEMVRVGERTCDVVLDCPDGVRVYPIAANDGEGRT